VAREGAAVTKSSRQARSSRRPLARYNDRATREEVSAMAKGKNMQKEKKKPKKTKK
jgi:hypothetical protein